MKVSQIGIKIGFVFALLLAVVSAKADVNSEVRLLSDSFISSSYNATNQSSYQFAGAAFTTDPHSPDNAKVDMNGAFAFGAPLMSYINVKEVSYRIDSAENQSFTVGRHHAPWSDLDRRWNFGMIEPVFKWNPLNPESQGLTGLFWDVKGENASFGLFGSFIYLPDQGPSFEINSDGQFVQGNPWFQQPPTSIKIFQQATDIQYHFDRPNETQVVMQTSYGAHAQIGDNTPWHARVSGLYLPMNQLALGYDGALSIAGGTQRGEVEIQPAVVYHTVTSTDLYYQGQRIRSGVSASYDHPNGNSTFDPAWTHPVYADATLLSPFIDVLLTRGWTASLQHLQVSGGKVTETGPLASPDRASITSRYPYQEATQVSLLAEQRVLRTRLLTMKTSYTQSTQNEFTLYRFEGRLELTRQWAARAEMQLVKASDLTSANRNEIAPFDNNDRLEVGLGYVF